MPNSLNVGTKDQFKELSMKEQDGKYHLHAVFNDKTMQNALKSAKRQTSNYKMEILMPN